jgi:multiple antibiotic resistance protein
MKGRKPREGHDMEAWLNAFLALFAIVNPLGNIPVVFDLSKDLDARTKRRMFNIASCTAFGTLAVLTICGEWIMDTVFHIEMAEFKIAGGILLTCIAVRNIIVSGGESRTSDGGDVMELSVVPLAIPILVGPGAVVTAILILRRDGHVVVFSAIAACFALTWLVLQSSSFLHRLIGRFGALALSRILQIFIAAIGVHFLTSGIKELFGLV